MPSQKSQRNVKLGVSGQVKTSLPQNVIINQGKLFKNTLENREQSIESLKACLYKYFIKSIILSMLINLLVMLNDSYWLPEAQSLEMSFDTKNV